MLILAALLMLSSGAVKADTIKLKGGPSVNGYVTYENGEFKLVAEFSDEVERSVIIPLPYVIKREDVEWVKFNPTVYNQGKPGPGLEKYNMLKHKLDKDTLASKDGKLDASTSPEATLEANVPENTIDELYLKTGDKVRGQLIRITKTELKLKTKSYNRKDVKEIAIDR